MADDCLGCLNSASLQNSPCSGGTLCRIDSMAFASSVLLVQLAGHGLLVNRAGAFRVPPLLIVPLQLLPLCAGCGADCWIVGVVVVLLMWLPFSSFVESCCFSVRYPTACRQVSVQ